MYLRKDAKGLCSGAHLPKSAAAFGKASGAFYSGDTNSFGHTQLLNAGYRLTGAAAPGAGPWAAPVYLPSPSSFVCVCLTEIESSSGAERTTLGSPAVPRFPARTVCDPRPRKAGKLHGSNARTEGTDCGVSSRCDSIGINVRPCSATLKHKNSR